VFHILARRWIGSRLRWRREVDALSSTVSQMLFGMLVIAVCGYSQCLMGAMVRIIYEKLI